MKIGHSINIKLTLMKGDKVVELLEKRANLLLFGIILRHR